MRKRVGEKRILLATLIVTFDQSRLPNIIKTGRLSLKCEAAPGHQYRSIEEKKVLIFATRKEESYNSPFTERELDSAFATSTDTAPGPNGIPYAMIKHLILFYLIYLGYFLIFQSIICELFFRIIQIDSSDEASDEETKGAGKHIGSHINPEDTTEENVQDCAGSVEVEILSGVSLFDPQKSQQEFKRLEQQILTLSEEEFMAAVDQDDYPALLASLRSDYIPVLEYSALFLKAARRGSRGIALLLATRVKDLSVRDEYGNSAICMAAEQGDICFAHHLFAMGVSKHECNGADETLQKIASKYGFRHFIRFLQRCEK
ncbi:uncharacterized protein [Palaemon carinicauda]|uniref:uncharacterized protein n=1 Tax=Palaemon carinicauda TaxID=392227 RepID=UPI0035B631EE